ncbi:MAG: hypothetical protein HQL53_08555 [Magnetococcales bacterium]|nr:hypothetical protein [Magnetococcales bacterium]
MNQPRHPQPKHPFPLRIVGANDNAPQVTLEQAKAMPVGQLAGMPINELDRLHQEAILAQKKAKQVKDYLDGVLAHKYDAAISRARLVSNKPTGIVRIIDGDHTIISDVPKRPNWDQKQLAEIANRIKAAGDDPAEYMETTYKVPENRFKAWPSSIRETFLPARTLKVGKTTFKIEKSKGAA